MAGKKYSRKDYEETIIKFLVKVQDKYLEEKALEHPELAKEHLYITDEDKIRQDLLDDIYKEIENKYHEKEDTIKALIKEC